MAAISVVNFGGISFGENICPYGCHYSGVGQQKWHCGGARKNPAAAAEFGERNYFNAHSDDECCR